jgi:hypothetical protein
LPCSRIPSVCLPQRIQTQLAEIAARTRRLRWYPPQGPGKPPGEYSNLGSVDSCVERGTGFLTVLHLHVPYLYLQIELIDSYACIFCPHGMPSPWEIAILDIYIKYNYFDALKHSGVSWETCEHSRANGKDPECSGSPVSSSEMLADLYESASAPEILGSP